MKCIATETYVQGEESLREARGKAGALVSVFHKSCGSISEDPVEILANGLTAYYKDLSSEQVRK